MSQFRHWIDLLSEDVSSGAVPIHWRKETGGGYWIGAWAGRFTMPDSQQWSISIKQQRSGWVFTARAVASALDAAKPKARVLWPTIFTGLRQFVVEEQPDIVTLAPMPGHPLEALLGRLAGPFEKMGYRVSGLTLTQSG